MFNPQRKSKVSDIYMDEKAFQLHLDKIKNIRQSYSLTTRRSHDQHQQETYLQRLSTRRQQVKDKMKNDIRRQNRRLLSKLNATDNRPEENPEHQSKEKHFNSYFNNRRENSRIKADNYNMLTRMIHQSAMIPSLQNMKKDFKQNKRYSKMVRKLPTIFKHEQQFKRQLSSHRLGDSKLSSRSKSSSRNKSLGGRAATQEILTMENTLLMKNEEA